MAGTIKLCPPYDVPDKDIEEHEPKMEKHEEKLLVKLSGLCHRIARGKCDQKSVDELFELTRTGKYPELLVELAESFGLMLVKVEAREFRLEETIAELEAAKGELESYSQSLELRVSERAAELQKANRELKRLVTLDGLTRIPNRRRFDEYLEQEWLRLQDTRSPLSLILGDVDYFKNYNDHYGHQAGDDCLRAIAEAVNRSAKRPHDLAARYGGEEFALILPNTDVQGALHLAAMLRAEVKRLKIEHPASSVNEYVTVSLGVATAIPTAFSSPEILIAMADKALYEAKKRGRDRIILRSPDPENPFVEAAD